MNVVVIMLIVCNVKIIVPTLHKRCSNVSCRLLKPCNFGESWETKSTALKDPAKSQCVDNPIRQFETKRNGNKLQIR